MYFRFRNISDVSAGDALRVRFLLGSHGLWDDARMACILARQHVMLYHSTYVNRYGRIP